MLRGSRGSAALLAWVLGPVRQTDRTRSPTAYAAQAPSLFSAPNLNSVPGPGSYQWAGARVHNPTEIARKSFRLCIRGSCGERTLDRP